MVAYFALIKYMIEVIIVAIFAMLFIVLASNAICILIIHSTSNLYIIKIKSCGL